MTTRTLHLATVSPDTPAARIQRLQAEASSLARAHVEQIIAQMGELSELLSGLTGDAYPIGAREVARQFGPQLNAQALGLRAILERR
jgi:hypothetical protein